MKKIGRFRWTFIIVAAVLALNPCCVYAAETEINGDNVQEETVLEVQEWNPEEELQISLYSSLEEYFNTYNEVKIEDVRSLILQTEAGYRLTMADFEFIRTGFVNLRRLDVTGSRFDSKETYEAYRDSFAERKEFSYNSMENSFDESIVKEYGEEMTAMQAEAVAAVPEARETGGYTLELNGICVQDKGSRVELGVAYESTYSGVEFRWLQYDLSTGVWSKISDWKIGNWTSWHPGKTGNYWIQAEARTMDGKTVQITSVYYYGGLKVNLSGICVQELGNRCNIGAVYESNDPGVTFQWKAYNLSERKWKLIQGRTAGNWASWHPEKAGDYWLHVEATDSKGDIKTYTAAYYFKGPQVFLNGICAMERDGKIDMGIAYQTNDPEIKFQWKIYDLKEEKWSNISANGWTAGNWVSWRPEKSGDYWLCAEARTGDGKIKRQIVNYRVNGAKITSFGTSEESPGWLGNRIKLTGKSTDPIGEIRSFRYLVYNGKDWKVLETKEDGTAEWKPEALGNYLLCYEIYNKAGKVIQQTFKAYNIEEPYVNLSGIYVRQDGEMQYKMAAAVQTNDRQIQYRWMYYDVTEGKWHELNGWNSSNAAHFTAPREGWFWFHVEAKLHDGTVKTYTLNYLVYKDRALIYANKILNQIGRDLYTAFNWSVSMPYSWTSADASPGSEWFAIYGFTNGYGDCYVMAGTFCYFAKALGYDAHQMDGYVPSRSGGNTPHSWVEIVINGATYVFDPDFTHETGRNGYQISYGTSGTWRYSGYYRIN